MIDKIIASRYAVALYDLDKNLFDYLHEFAELFNIKEFKQVILSPIVDIKIKKQTVQKILLDAPVIFTNFINLLLDKNRMYILPIIYSEYRLIKNKKDNIIQIVIYSPKKLDDTQIQSIGEKYKKYFNAKAFDATLIIDEALLGGVCIKIDDLFIDDSLKNKLNKIKNRTKDVKAYDTKVN